MQKHVCMYLMCLCILVTDSVLSAEILVARGGNGFYPPHDMVINNTLTGFHIDLVNAVARKLDLKVSFKSLPWKRAVYMLQNGSLDAVTYMTRTVEREKFGYFLDGNVLSVAQFGYFVLKEREQEFEYSGDIKQLQPYVIGTIRGYSYGQVFDNATYLSKDDGAGVEEQQIAKLLGKRYDIGIGVVARIRYIARQMGVGDKIVFLRPYLSKTPCYIVFSKKRDLEQLAQRFADTMEAFKKTEEYQNLKNKYGMIEE